MLRAGKYYVKSLPTLYLLFSGFCVEGGLLTGVTGVTGGDVVGLVVLPWLPA